MTERKAKAVLQLGKPQISQLRCAQVEMTNLEMLRAFAFPSLGHTKSRFPSGMTERKAKAVLQLGKPQISQLRCAPVEMTNLEMLRAFAFPSLGHTKNRFPSGMTERKAKAVLQLGKPQISQLRCAPVEMTNLGMLRAFAFPSLGHTKSRFPSGMTERKAKAVLQQETADLSTSLRSGRDDKFRDVPGFCIPVLGHTKSRFRSGMTERKAKAVLQPQRKPHISPQNLGCTVKLPFHLFLDCRMPRKV